MFYVFLILKTFTRPRIFHISDVFFSCTFQDRLVWQTRTLLTNFAGLERNIQCTGERRFRAPYRFRAAMLSVACVASKQAFRL